MFVTHDQEEALGLVAGDWGGDQPGRIEQIGARGCGEPANRFVMGFLGAPPWMVG